MSQAVQRFIRLTSSAEVLGFVRHYWPEIATFEECRYVSRDIQLPQTDPESPVEYRKATIFMPTHDGVVGGVADEGADPVTETYTDEDGNAFTVTKQPVVKQPDGAPYLHVNLLWGGTEAELVSVAIPALQAALQPDNPHARFAL